MVDPRSLGELRSRVRAHGLGPARDLRKDRLPGLVEHHRAQDARRIVETHRRLGPLDRSADQRERIDVGLEPLPHVVRGLLPLARPQRREARHVVVVDVRRALRFAGEDRRE